ncbi:MAG: DivIVA domain-containing protein [Clostridia bacterium]|nr:DivIVA domain-containing protein [Clostridia bacterium]
MLPPHEIKSKGFTHAIRGYSAEEVDEYAEFVLKKYTELYRENDMLETKIAEMKSQLEKYSSDEESIRSALVEAQRSSAKIIDEANERSRIILHSAKLNCDRILSEFRSAVKEERDELLLLRGMVKKFKEELFVAYQTHIEYIEKIAPELDSLDESEFSDDAIIRLAVESIKSDIISNHGNGGAGEADETSAAKEDAHTGDNGDKSDTAEASSAADTAALKDESDSPLEEIVQDNSSGKIDLPGGSNEDKKPYVFSEDTESSEELTGNKETFYDPNGHKTDSAAESEYDESDLVAEIMDIDSDSLSDVVNELENDIDAKTLKNSGGSLAADTEVSGGDYSALRRLEEFELNDESDSVLGVSREKLSSEQSQVKYDDKSDEFLRTPDDSDGVGKNEEPIDDSDDLSFLKKQEEDDDMDYLDFLRDITNG